MLSPERPAFRNALCVAFAAGATAVGGCFDSFVPRAPILGEDSSPQCAVFQATAKPENISHWPYYDKDANIRIFEADSSWNASDAENGISVKNKKIVNNL